MFCNREGIRIFFLKIVSSMGCFFGCFRIKDGYRSQSHLFSNNASSKSRDPLVSRNQLSSLFSLEGSPCKDVEKNGLQSKYNAVDGDTDDRDLKAEVRKEDCSDKCKLKIEKMEFDMKIKEDLKTVALGTSKINYLDPRISVAWCKRHEVPIEKVLAEHYPRGNKELRGSFFIMHSPLDTMSWFSDHGVELKTEDDGRVFPVSNNSSSAIDCLLVEAKRSGD